MYLQLAEYALAMISTPPAQTAGSRQTGSRLKLHSVALLARLSLPA